MDESSATWNASGSISCRGGPGPFPARRAGGPDRTVRLPSPSLSEVEGRAGAGTPQREEVNYTTHIGPLSTEDDDTKKRDLCDTVDLSQKFVKEFNPPRRAR